VLTVSTGDSLAPYVNHWPFAWGLTRSMSPRWGTGDAVAYNQIGGLTLVAPLVSPGSSPTITATATAGSAGRPTWLFAD